MLILQENLHVVSKHSRAINKKTVGKVGVGTLQKKDSEFYFGVT